MSLEKLKDKILNNITLIIVLVFVVIIIAVYKYDRELSETLGIAPIVLAAFVYLIKEKFKSDLEKEVIRFKIKYEKLHIERAEVIKNLYQKIYKTEHAFKSSMGRFSNGPTQENINESRKVAMEMIKYYGGNKIFLEESLCKDIDLLIKKYDESWRLYNLSKNLKEENLPSSRKGWIEEWYKALDNIQDNILPIQKNIENKFRKIIGIE